MNPRKTTRIVGVLFIIATATYMLGSGYLEPILYVRTAIYPRARAFR